MKIPDTIEKNTDERKAVARFLKENGIRIPIHGVSADFEKKTVKIGVAQSNEAGDDIVVFSKNVRCAFFSPCDVENQVLSYLRELQISN